jgi:hypothetical protein
MAFKKEDVTELFDILDDYRTEVKEINANIKSEFDAFAAKHQVNVKHMKKVYKAYCDYMKNKEEFELVDLEISNILNLLTNEVKEEVVTTTVKEEE